MKNLFQQSTLDLSRQLLGMELIHEIDGKATSGRIVEVEAYKGPEDRGAHSYGGRRTKRTEVMYGRPGHAYIYLIYGMHFCFNIVTGVPDKPEAILVRALEPLRGIDRMAERRGIHLAFDEDGNPKQNKMKPLTNGPGKLCQALGISMEQYGHDLTRKPLYIKSVSEPLAEEKIATGPRINIDYAGEARFYPWRFWIKDHSFVSR